MPEVLANINILLICFCQEEITIITQLKTTGMFTEAKLLSRLTHPVNACIINIFLMIQDPLRTIFFIYIYIFNKKLKRLS